ncbi:MAG: hypothetical protein CM15mV13_2050 [uncultured marine virus]|nr:MAG: hypothetical protein CM15mV13_2050 [uncultured marine virus]
MKKTFIAFGILGMLSPLAARADLTHKLTSSVQLQVDAAILQYREQQTHTAPVGQV